MGQTEPHAERRLVETVERGETAREQLAVGGALGEPVEATKAEQRRETALGSPSDRI
jgi:hypothetical protein